MKWIVVNGEYTAPMIHQSTDGRWQIEPMSTSGLGEPGMEMIRADGTGWCLLDRTDEASGYIRCGTLDQMKALAESESAIAPEGKD